MYISISLSLSIYIYIYIYILSIMPRARRAPGGRQPVRNLLNYLFIYNPLCKIRRLMVSSLMSKNVSCAHAFSL